LITLGKATFGSIHDSAPGPGSMVSWQPSPTSVARVRQAPISAVPASYIQVEHLNCFRGNAAQGNEIPGLLIPSWDIAGQCDIRVMTYVINAHLRRHDTYRSWFEFTDADVIVRHTISDPSDIEFAPTVHGEVTPDEWRAHILATPNPLNWDCFRFVLIQRPDHFTFFMCVDHLHSDMMSICVAFTEINSMYAALVDGGRPDRLPEAGSYDDYCVRERASLSALTLDSPAIRRWVEFAENNDGTLPDFPLPLGDELAPADTLIVPLMDVRQTAAFEAACIAAGARFSGGVFACAALAQHELTGASTYYGLTSVETRRTPADFMTIGWLTGHVPLTVPVIASSFAATARAAQASFDSCKDLANVPFRVALELAPWLRWPPRPHLPMLFFFDASVPPLSALFSSHSNVNFSQYFNGVAADFNIRVMRLENETHVVVRFPNNPVARDSVVRYVTAMKAVYARVADTRAA
jgi:mycolipenoyl-CoA---2-(long-chain-fatty acyl)-trehalose mycolipenoyltransferase / long-chain-acyl-CoA---trehalose acyltransferase